ncbi:hypothetical protein EI555_017942 [Monodon monoceros]|uniref:Kinetochore assembly subunit CENP-C N-terminal domain-containing protein n=1 Tax=Monodon monoceros TaxID=40151 RepID=A0A4U1EJK5_MONMO|nr:hypothetical protein EI555_017942 [Monodon monoceros]
MAAWGLDHLKNDYRRRFCRPSRAPDINTEQGQNILEILLDCFEEKSLASDFSTNSTKSVLYSTPKIKDICVQSPSKETQCQKSHPKSGTVSSRKKEAPLQLIVEPSEAVNKSVQAHEVHQEILATDVHSNNTSDSRKMSSKKLKDHHSEADEEFYLSIGLPSDLLDAKASSLQKTIPSVAQKRETYTSENSVNMLPSSTEISHKTKKRLNFEDKDDLKKVEVMNKVSEIEDKVSEGPQERKQLGTSQKRIQDSECEDQPQARKSFSTLFLETVKRKGSKKGSTNVPHAENQKKDKEHKKKRFSDGSKKNKIVPEELTSTVTRSRRISRRPSNWWVVKSEQNDSRVKRCDSTPENKVHHKLVLPSNTPHVRRTMRTRSKPLEYWRGERIDYQGRPSGGFVIGGILSPDKVSSKRKAKGNLGRVNTIVNRKRICLDNDERKNKFVENLNVPLGDPLQPTRVKDPETREIILMDLVRPRDTYQFCVEHGELKVYKTLDTPFFSTGKLILGPHQEKGKQHVGLDTLHMTLADVKAMFTELQKDVCLLLLTNGERQTQKEIEACACLSYFDANVVDGEQKVEKPAPSIFYYSCDLLGVELGDYVMVGDTLETDIQEGLNAGLKATVWKDKNGMEPLKSSPMPHYIVSSVLELPAVLQSVDYKVSVSA